MRDNGNDSCAVGLTRFHAKIDGKQEMIPMRTTKRILAACALSLVALGSTQAIATASPVASPQDEAVSIIQPAGGATTLGSGSWLCALLPHIPFCSENA